MPLITLNHKKRVTLQWATTISFCSITLTGSQGQVKIWLDDGQYCNNDDAHWLVSHENARLVHGSRQKENHYGNVCYFKNWKQNLWEKKLNTCMVSWKLAKSALRRIFMVRIFHTTCIWNETTVLKIKCIIFFLTKILKDFRVIADEWQNS